MRIPGRKQEKLSQANHEQSKQSEYGCDALKWLVRAFYIVSAYLYTPKLKTAYKAKYSLTRHSAFWGCISEMTCMKFSVNVCRGHNKSR